MVCEKMHANDFAAGLVSHQFDHAVGLTGNHGFGVDTHRHFHFGGIKAACFGLSQRQADKTCLRTRECYAAIEVLIVLRGLTQQVFSGDAALRCGGVGQHVAANDVAHCIDVRLRSLAMGIHLDRCAVQHYACFVEIQFRGVRTLARSDQYDVAAECGFNTLFICVTQIHRARCTRNFVDFS